MRVLWLDDEPDTVAPFAEALCARGHPTELVRTMKQFEDKLRFGEFELAIIDVVLPSSPYQPSQTRDGFDTGLLLARRLQQEAPGVRIVLLTNRIDTRKLNEEHEVRVYSKMDVSPWALADLIEKDCG